MLASPAAESADPAANAIGASTRLKISFVNLNGSAWSA